MVCVYVWKYRVTNPPKHGESQQSLRHHLVGIAFSQSEPVSPSFPGPDWEWLATGSLGSQPGTLRPPQAPTPPPQG